MLDIVQKFKKNTQILVKLSPVFSFIVPFLILYLLYPNTFEATWTGTWENRIPYIFFLWLFSLETILNWEEIRSRKCELKPVKTVVFIVALLLPTIYVIIANYFGLNALITISARHYNIKPAWAELMPLSTEYLVFAVLFALIVLLQQGSRGLKDYSISTFFLVVIGAIYTINNTYPMGQFTLFQILVPTTAMFAANVLNLMGYQTSLNTRSAMPVLYASNSQNSFVAAIDWPCSGIESLLIYTVTILLFLKKSIIPLKHKTIYFVIGAAVTYVINILRIVTIVVIAINNGDWGIFHDYYAQLYSITWIISYPLIIIGSRALWRKLKHKKIDARNVSV